MEKETLNASLKIKDMDKRVGIQGYRTPRVSQLNAGIIKIAKERAVPRLREENWHTATLRRPACR
jgi:hypothetical protein